MRQYESDPVYKLLLPPVNKILIPNQVIVQLEFYKFLLDSNIFDFVDTTILRSQFLN
jgi:hypothetical protein